MTKKAKIRVGRPRIKAPCVYTHSFCLTKGAWNIIRDYALDNDMTYSSALRELLTIANEKLKQDKKGSLL